MDHRLLADQMLGSSASGSFSGNEWGGQFSSVTVARN